MEPTKFIANHESRPCECGGKTQMTPCLRAKHTSSFKHRNYVFMVLCVEFLECEDKAQKRELLKQMKALLVNP